MQWIWISDKNARCAELSRRKRERCGKMLFSGATSYWETPLGEADFDDAGSLCHAWTSVACYIFDKYLPQAK